VLRRGDRTLGERFALAHLRQALAFVVLLLVVLTFLIERQEAVELDHRAGRAQIEQARADLARDVDGGALELGRFHLARDGAQPDQLVEPRLVGIEEFATSRGRRARRSGAPLRALPARSSACSDRCAARPARIACRSSTRSRCGSR
jgi:hypothetical protein